MKLLWLRTQLAYYELLFARWAILWALIANLMAHYDHTYWTIGFALLSITCFPVRVPRKEKTNG